MDPKPHEHPSAEPPPEWLEVVRRSVDKLRFGSVQVIVHDGQVTQIESLERTRFPASGGRESGNRGANSD